MTTSVLSKEQLGHLRHWDNLSRLQKNDWSMMQTRSNGQENSFSGYRFQLAYMIYGLALTHRHRLPAAPGVFQPTIQRLIDKLLLPEVWLYWRDVSRGGSVLNDSIADRMTEEWNPVVRDNIMYSAYVQSCALLHDHMFAADRYAQPGSLTLRHWSFFWGGEEKRFEYDRNSLNEHLYWQMVENGYLGIACEPNCVFQICNQPAILGFRLHDLLTGTDRASEVVEGYEKAWADFGRLDRLGHYNQMVIEDAQVVVAPSDVSPDAPMPWVDAWAGALMNMWNHDFVHEHYQTQVADFLLTGPDGTLSVPSSPPPQAMGLTSDSESSDMGWVTIWASEMGDQSTLDGLLGHADRFLEPTWRDAGLYYPRNDAKTDEHGNNVENDPLTGNVLIGYARLNVADGLHKLYSQPWGADHHAEPALVEVDRDVEVSRAEVVDGTLHARLRRDTTLSGAGTVTLVRLPKGARLRLNGVEITGEAVDGLLVLQVPDGPAVDLVAAP